MTPPSVRYSTYVEIGAMNLHWKLLDLPILFLLFITTSAFSPREGRQGKKHFLRLKKFIKQNHTNLNFLFYYTSSSVAFDCFSLIVNYFSRYKLDSFIIFILREWQIKLPRITKYFLTLTDGLNCRNNKLMIVQLYFIMIIKSDMSKVYGGTKIR